MKKFNWNDRRVGIVLGMIGPVIGFFLYMLIYTYFISPHLTFDYFINKMFIGTPQYHSPIISLSLIFNVLLFLLFFRLDYDKTMRGLLITFFIYGALILALYQWSDLI